MSLVTAKLFDANSATPQSQVVTKYTTTGVVANPPAAQTVIAAAALPRSSVWKYQYREVVTATGAAAASAWGIFTIDNAGTLAAASLPAVPTAVAQVLNGVTVGYGAGAALQVTGSAATNTWTCSVTPYC